MTTDAIPGAKPSPDDHPAFNTSHLDSGIGRRSARGAVVTLFGRFGKFGIQLGGMAILSRLLTPGDFGLVNMASVVTGFMTMFGDMGLSAAVIQKAEIRHNQMSTLFWLNAALGLALALVSAGAAPFVAGFYHDPRLLAITIAAGTGFIISGLGIQHQALMKRQMRFPTLAAVDLCGGLAGALAGIGCAFAGLGYWSLVVMQLAVSATVAAGSWICCKWRPGLPARRTGIESIVAFGGNLTIFNSLNYLVRNMDNVLVGRRWGAAELGFYSRAYQLMLMPLSQIVGPVGTVAIPALSRLQNDPLHFRDYYLKGLRVIAYASMPMLVVMAVLSDDIIELLLGPRWHPASRIFRILAMAAVFQPVVSSSGWIMTALNRGKTMAIWGVVTTPVMIGAFFLGLPWGAFGVACGYTLADWSLSWPALFVAMRQSPVNLMDIGRVVYRPFILSLLLGAGVFSLGYFGNIHTPILVVALAPVVCIAILLAARFAWPGLRTDLDMLLSTARVLTGKQGVPSAA